MSDAKKPPAFYCPDCRQKHRTSLDALKGKPEAVIRLLCVGCAGALAVRLGQDGGPVCTREAAPPDAAPLAPKADAPESEAAEPKAPESKPPESKPPESKPPESKPPESKAPPSEAVEAEASKPAPAPAPARRKRGKGAAPTRTKRRKGKAAAEEAGAVGDAAPSEPETAPAGKDESERTGEDAPGATPGRKDREKEETLLEGEFGEHDAVGRYTIEKAIGKGGSSTVYKAFDPTTNRSVALKVLDKEAHEVFRTRFLREIEVQANIRHQNIMPVFDRGTLDDGRPFFTMELLYRPWTLAEIVERRDEGRLGRYATMKKFGEIENIVRDVIIPVADGIYVANVENGVIHRDLKPENVLVDTRTGRPYVIDFGICQVLEKKSGFASKAVIPPTTEDEGIVGTPRFLAPEQVKGHVHARTDVWGLGAMIFAVITGEPPIATAQNISKTELKRRIEALEVTKQKAVEAGDERKIGLCEEQLVRLTDPGIRTVDALFRDARDGTYSELPATTSSPLRAVIRKAMATSTSDRYVNARQLATELQAWLDGKSVRALTEAGGKAAAVETARRAVRAHLVTALWILGGLGLGLLIAKGTVTPGATPPSTRVADAEADIKLLADNLDGLQRVADNLTAVERNRLWTSLDGRARNIAARLAEEPDDASVDAIRERLAFVRSRFAPPRIRIAAPSGTALLARNLVTQGKLTLAPGENSLPPGAYQVTAGAVRFPIEVPLLVRTPDAARKFKVEPALETFAISPAGADAPAGTVLVLGGRVLARDLPFNAPSTSATTVAPFFMDATEVTNAQYAQFLASLDVATRKEHAPEVGFIPDPEQAGAPIVTKGREDAPVVGLRADDARAYAAWRSRRAGATVRLPTEAEWVLAAGASLGYHLANGSKGERTDAELASPLREAGAHVKDLSPFGVRGMLGNAREMVASSLGDLDAGAVLVKGAGVGDDPDRGAIYIHRILDPGARQPITGFRCVQEIPAQPGR